MEKPAFESIVREYRRFVHRTLARFRVCSRDLDDVMQKVWRAVERRLPEFDPSKAAQPPEAVRAWLFGICRRQAASHHRNRRRLAEDLRDAREVEHFAAGTPSAEDRLLVCDEEAHLESVLAEVEPLRRAVFVAHEIHGVPMSDIARAQGIPVNTAWNRLRLARADIRAAWDSHKRRGPT